MYLQASRHIGLNYSFFGVWRRWRALRPNKGASHTRALRPKLVAVEASKALFGVTFVYRVLRVITQSQVRARSSHTILSIQSVFIDLLLCVTLDNDLTQCPTRK